SSGTTPTRSPSRSTRRSGRSSTTPMSGRWTSSSPTATSSTPWRRSSSRRRRSTPTPPRPGSPTGRQGGGCAKCRPRSSGRTNRPPAPSRRRARRPRKRREPTAIQDPGPSARGHRLGATGRASRPVDHGTRACATYPTLAAPSSYHPGMTTTRATAIDPKVEAWLDARADERLESYKAFLRIPSISALPEHAADCRRAAEWIADDLPRIGVDHVEVADTSGHPVVYGDRLAADVAVISDTGFFEGNIPAITVGLRGLMYAQIDVVGSPVDLHSGGYGGVVQNPANALASIIAALHDGDGRVAIPGFYDDVDPLSDDDRRRFADLPFDEDAYLAELELPGLFGEPGYTTLERRGARPSLDVNGMWSGFQGEGAKTIIPAHAHAKVSARLVPSQDPDVIFDRLEAFVRRIAPPGVRTSV